MKSMTGYGKGEAANTDTKITVEIKSVNHKLADIAVKAPRVLICFDDMVRAEILKSVSRGHFDVYVTAETIVVRENVASSINMDVVESYRNMAVALAEKGISDDLTFSNLIRLPNVLKDADITVNENTKAIYCEAVKAAMKGLVEMREREGKALGEDLMSKLDSIEQKVQLIKQRSPQVVADYRDKLKARINELLENTQLNAERLEQEVAIFADKACIDEELTRLDTHFVSFRKDLQSAVPVGRRLDFLMQEMNREINTIGSKANDAVIAGLVVEVKAEFEKIREQVQNIE